MKNTSIQWAVDTVNPTSGCAGCELARPSLSEHERVCYAYQVHMNRLRHSLPDKYAQSFFDVKLIAGRIAQYARGRDLRGVAKHHPWIPKEYPRVIFISDMADALSPGIPFEYLRDEIINVAGRTMPGMRHIWMWLTKQPKRLVEFYDWLERQGIEWPANIWAGVSVTAPNVQWRVEHLRSRAFYRTFVSYEPAWDWIDFFPSAPRFPSMIIAGGESGRLKRPFDLRWAQRLIEQCRDHGTAPFIKQLGANPVGFDGPGAIRLFESAKDSHGGDWDVWPEHLRVREFPSFA